jgi:NAD-dependent deacetylase
MSDAAAAVARCDLLLVVGSTLQVFPAASLPLAAKQAGAAVVIVNLGPTAMDEIADAFVDARAGEALPRLVEKAHGPSPDPGRSG